jgi:hypothetical protein
MAGAGLNVGRQLAHSARLPPQHVRSREPDQPHAGRRDHAGAQRAVSRASGLDRIVGVMSATGSYDTLPSHRCRGATVGPPACSAQSSSVVFRARCRICLQGLSSSWDDWRRHAASLIGRGPRFESWIAHPPEFRNSLHLHDALDLGPRVDQAIWVVHGATWGHQPLPAGGKALLGSRRQRVGAGLRERRPARAEGTGRRARNVRLRALGGPAGRHRPHRPGVERRRLRDRGRDATAWGSPSGPRGSHGMSVVRVGRSDGLEHQHGSGDRRSVHCRDNESPALPLRPRDRVPRSTIARSWHMPTIAFVAKL